MTFNKSKSVDVLQKNEVLFCNKLNPVEILPYLTSMSDMSREEIEREQNNYGQKRASSLLLKRIRQQDKCLVEFIRALKYSDIPLEDLADKLDPQHVIVDTGQCPEEHTFPVSSARVSQKSPVHVPYFGNTPLRHLSYAVMNILQNKLDYDDKWKDLASYLDYTIEGVQKLQSTNKSCTKQIIDEWYDATVDTLFKALDFIERKDIITDIEKVIGVKSVFSEEAFIDIQEHKSRRQDVVESAIKSSNTRTKQEPELERKENHCDITNKLVHSGEYIDEKDLGKQSSVCISDHDYIPQKDIGQSISEHSQVEISTNKEPCSLENNALQPLSDRNNVMDRIPEDMTSTFNNNSEVLDGELKSLCENNSNTRFTEKNMKDKIIDHMPKVHDNRLLIGAGIFGAVALGFIAFQKSS